MISLDFDKKFTSLDKNIAISKNLNVSYFILQWIYNELKLDEFLKKVTAHNKMKYDCSITNRFLIFYRIIYTASKLYTQQHLYHYCEQPQYQYHDSMRFLSILAENFVDYIAHLYKYSNHIVKSDTSICYYDRTNYYFEIECPDDDYVDEVSGEEIPAFRKYSFSKQHQPNPLVQMGLFMDRHGIPLSMPFGQGNKNE